MSTRSSGYPGSSPSSAKSPCPTLDDAFLAATLHITGDLRSGRLSPCASLGITGLIGSRGKRCRSSAARNHRLIGRRVRRRRSSASWNRRKICHLDRRSERRRRSSAARDRRRRRRRGRGLGGTGGDIAPA